MFKLFIKVSFLISFLSLALISCKKEEENDIPDNPTNGKTEALFNPDISYGTLRDQDGNLYKTVSIGTQTWMAENLRTTKYNDGSPIPNLVTSEEWLYYAISGYCNLNNSNNLDTIATFGRYYNWDAVHTGNLAPKGWHIPSKTEWEALITFLGGEDIAGNKIAETGTTHWHGPNSESTNESGFTAIPAGFRRLSSLFEFQGDAGYWWSITSYDSDDAFAFYTNGSYFSSYVMNKTYGFSIRCIKNN